MKYTPSPPVFSLKHFPRPSSNLALNLALNLNLILNLTLNLILNLSLNLSLCLIPLHRLPHSIG